MGWKAQVRHLSHARGNIAGGDTYILEMERSFGYSQASSDILAIEECSDEDIQYIVELHSDAFADA